MKKRPEAQSVSGSQRTVDADHEGVTVAVRRPPIAESEANRVFGGFSARLRSALGEPAWRQLAADLRVGHADRERVVLCAPNAMLCERLQDRVGPRRLGDLWSEVDPLARKIDIIADPKPQNAVSANDGGSSAGDGCGPSVARLKTFANFVTGPANKSAAMAAKVIARDADAGFTLLYLYGEQGIGKTHLLTAIEAAALDADPDQKVMFFNAERFRSDYVRALNERNAITFKEEVCAADVLIIDDLHAVAGSKATENELLAAITTILSRNGRVIIAADRLPEDIEKMDDRLRKRVATAVSFELQRPDQPLRRRILERMVADNTGMRRGHAVPDDVIDFIASAIKDTPRALEAALATVLLQTVLMDVPVTHETAREALKDMSSSSAQRVTVDQIQKVVAEYHGIKVSELLSKRRTHDIVRPRQQAMYLCKVMTSRSYPDIGRRFNKMDHTTVLHAYRRIAKMYHDDPRIRSDIDQIRRMLRKSGQRRPSA